MLTEERLLHWNLQEGSVHDTPRGHVDPSDGHSEPWTLDEEFFPGTEEALSWNSSDLTLIKRWLGSNLIRELLSGPSSPEAYSDTSFEQYPHVAEQIQQYPTYLDPIVGISSASSSQWAQPKSSLEQQHQELIEPIEPFLADPNTVSGIEISLETTTLLDAWLERLQETEPAEQVPADLDPAAGIEIISETTVQSLGEKNISQPLMWYPGQNLPIFKELAWNDLERLFDIFHIKKEDIELTPSDLAPLELWGFQQQLRAFYIYKTEEISSQLRGIPDHLKRLEQLTETEKESRAKETHLQQRVEDFLAVGEGRPAVIGVIKEVNKVKDCQGV